MAHHRIQLGPCFTVPHAAHADATGEQAEQYRDALREKFRTYLNLRPRRRRHRRARTGGKR